jgi:hypothetical protein
MTFQTFNGLDMNLFSSHQTANLNPNIRPNNNALLLALTLTLLLNKFIYVNEYTVLVGKPEGKRPLGRPRRRWEDNIKMDLEEVGGGCGDWMEWAQDRWRALVRPLMNFRVP